VEASKRVPKLSLVGLELVVEGVQCAQRGELAARLRQVAGVEGSPVALLEFGLPGGEAAGQLLHVVEGRRVAGLQLQREPVVEDRLGQPPLALVVAAALLVLDYQALELRLDDENPLAGLLVARGVLGNPSPGLEGAELVALAVQAFTLLERRGTARYKERECR